MAFRTIIIKSRAKLETRLGYMIVRAEKESAIHLSEISTVLIESTGVALTTALINELIKNKVNIIVCDEKHMPTAQISPFYINYQTSKNVKIQCGWKDEIKASVWTQIIYQKIFMQKNLLKKLNFDEAAELLNSYLNQLQPGDSTNREGHAAKVYFNCLFGLDFKRERDLVEYAEQEKRQNTYVNAALNYYYAILLSCVSREVAAAGYITQLGIWHINEFNQFNLACDIMEPFRPIVDDFVFSIIKNDENFKEKSPVIFTTQVKINEKFYYFEQAISIFTKNVLNALNNESGLAITNIEEYILGKYEL